MTATIAALILAALASAFAAAAIFVALLAFRRAPLAGNGPMELAATPQSGTFHDVALIAAMQGMLSHGDTRDRNPGYISARAKSIADQMVQVRRAA